MNRLVLLAALIPFCLGGRAAAAPADAPPALDRLEALLELHAEHPADAVERFSELLAAPLRESYGPDGIRELHGAIATELGDGFEVLDLVVDGPHRAHARVRHADGPVNVFRIETRESAPHGIMGFSIRPEGADGTLGEVPDLGSLHDLDAFLEETARDGRFGGVVLVARPGEEAFVRAYGMADREHGLANTPDTRFNVGSITKTFTQVVVFQLLDEERLSLDDPVGRYVDGLDPGVAAVTLRQLLRHESGIPEYVGGPVYMEERHTYRTIDDVLPRIRRMTLEAEPGDRSQYCNTNYVLLGAVIEAVTGHSYFDDVQTRVFDPAGMVGSGFPLQGDRAPGRAVAYSYFAPDTDDGPAPFVDRGRGLSDGGSYSTATDLWRFREALGGGRLLPRRTLALMRAGGDADRIDENLDVEGVRCEAGGAPGVSAAMCFDHTGRMIVVLANQDEPIAEEVSGVIEPLVFTAAGGPAIEREG